MVVGATESLKDFRHFWEKKILHLIESWNCCNQNSHSLNQHQITNNFYRLENGVGLSRRQNASLHFQNKWDTQHHSLPTTLHVIQQYIVHSSFPHMCLCWSLRCYVNEIFNPYLFCFLQLKCLRSESYAMCVRGCAAACTILNKIWCSKLNAHHIRHWLMAVGGRLADAHALHTQDFKLLCSPVSYLS